MAGPTLFRPDKIPTGLVGYWKLDEASGSRADSSGNGNTLTDNNTVASVAQDYWKTGENSADFERSNSESLSRTDASIVGLEPATDWSFACWVKKESATNGGLIGKDSNGYYVSLTDLSQITIRSGASSDNSATGVISVGKWHHVACTYTNSGTLGCIYLDGNLIKTTTSVATPSYSTADFYLGFISNGSQYHDGLMKDAALWNVALTPIQIKSLALGVDLANFAYRPSNVSTLPTAWWKLNELSGTRNDSIGSNHLTDNNTVGALGGYIEGVGADFESGSSEYLSIVNASQTGLNATGSICFATWIKFETVSGAQTIFSRGGADRNGYHLDTNFSNLRFYVNASYYPLALPSTLVAGVWYHFAVLFDASADTVKYYLDGILWGTVSSVTATITSNTNDFYLGRSAAATDYLDGVMADACFWNGYLPTEAEIKSLACGIPLQQTGIVSYWKLDETSGNRADSIGSNTLTDNNTVLSGTGKVSNAADFEAANSEYLEVANNDSIDIISDLSIVGWIKPESIGITAVVLDKDYNNDGYGVIVDATNKINFYNTNTASTSSTSVAAGTWAHFAGIYTGAARELWFNSAREDNDAYTTNPADTTTALRLGSTIAGGSYNDGLMDEVLLAKRWFRDEEIKTIYCKGLAGKELTSEERASSSGNFLLMF